MPDNFLGYITLGMGNTKSKPKDRFGRTKEPSTYSAGAKDTEGSIDESRDNDFFAEIHKRFVEDEELKILRHNIQYNPELFILNNLMMSVQFFGNYEEEIANIRQTLVSSREAELNARLPPQKHILIPDVLQQHVSRRVDFTYIDPTLKLTIEPLHPIRIYVAFDNIEVTEKSFATPYCSLNEIITYSMQLKPSPNHKGYVLLRRLDVNPRKKTISVDNLDLASMSNGNREEIYSDSDILYGAKSNTKGLNGLPKLDKNHRDVSDDESIYDDRRYGSQGNLFAYPSTSRDNDGSIYGSSAIKATEARRGGTKNFSRQNDKTRLLRSAKGSPAGSSSSGYRSGNYMDSDSDYSYARTIYNTPKTSKGSLDSGAMISSTEIPRQCFRKIEYTHDGKIYDARKDKKHKTNSKEQLIRQAYKSRNYQIWYLNSTKFMKYFCHLFIVQLAEPMDFDPNIKDSVQGGVICRTKLEVFEETMNTKLEQFEIVPSVTYSQWPECAQEWLDRPRGNWPHYSVIEKVKEFRCHMIPERILSDKPDRYQDLEWQLIFPAAERYLETCLTYPQVRVYLIAVMLQKTFIRPVDSIFGLTVSHIKNKLFWLIEEDDRSSLWMENRTGESLMKLLNSIYRSISQDTPNLPDYFVREKNLFQEKSYLLRTQKQLKRIIENPVMYVFHAMENIRHSRKFFPRLNFEKLFEILTADTVTLAHPALVSQLPRHIARSNGSENDYDQVGGFWDKTNQNSEEQKLYTRKTVTKRSLINPRQAYDQVVEIPVRCEKMDAARISCLLNFFIKHFIEMAERCHNYRALPQMVAYLDQAERLSVLLSENPTQKDIAKIYLEKLCSLKMRAASSRSPNGAANTMSSDPPETPRRNADRAIFVKPLKHRYDSLEILEEKQQKLQISQIKEKEEYELESGSSSFYSQETSSQTRDSRTIVNVTIHEQETKNVELRNPNKVDATVDKAMSSKNQMHVVSIADTHDDSFSSHSTYI